LLVDAATGLVLQQRNDGFHSVAEWEELELDVVLPDELFVWEGRTQQPPDRRAEHEADMAQRQQWLESHGMTALTLTLRSQLMLHEQSADGTLHASLQAGLNGSLARRPRSDEPWDIRMNWPHMRRWASTHWDWSLGTNEPLTEELLAEIQQQLPS
jgi:hypothetical protein